MRRQDIELFNKLFAALEDDQIFLDAHMSLSKMSVIVGTNTTYLSYAINDYFGDNFRSVINRYRVAYAVNLLLEEKQKANIKNIYLRCGFLSKSTFYASFTKIMGVPPLQFVVDAESSPKTAAQYCPVKSKNAILSSLSSAYAAAE